MNVIARLHDWRHEREIRKAVRYLAACPFEYRRQAATRLRDLVAKRSPAQVARMERKRGLA